MTEDVAKAKFSLALSGVGINVEREIDREAALRVLNIVLGGETAVAAPSEEGAHASAEAAPLSLREYLDEVQAVRKPDQIVAIAHFLCEHEGLADVGRDDIKMQFSAAREPLPRNFARDFAWAIKNGWLAASHGKSDRYYVTGKGAEAIESRFSSDVKRATSSAKRGYRRRRIGLGG